MVDRVESKRLDEFEGKVESVEMEQGIEERRQYHVVIEPVGFEINSATKRLHEWVPLSPRATEDSVPQGSVMDRYLTQVEICISAAKRAKTVKEALQLMVGHTLKFKRIKLGKDFEGHAAKEYIVPVALLK